MCHGGRSSGRQGSFEQNPNLRTLPASTSGTLRPVGCIRGLWNWAPGHGPGCTPVVPQGLGLRGRASAARGWHPGGGGSVLPINLSLFPSSHWPERILPRPQGQGAPWQAHSVRTPAGLLQPRVLPCPGAPAPLWGHCHTGVWAGLPLIGSSLKVGGGSPLRQDCCLVN